MFPDAGEIGQHDMSAKIQRVLSRIAVPWRNGMGVQYEVTADGPLPDGWSWRLSTADLAHDVPFSAIAGVHRKFCVAIGNGVVLTIDGVSHRCGPRSMTSFDGEATVQAAIINGPAKAINLMVKHGSPSKHLSIHSAGENVTGVEALVAIDGGAQIIVDDESVELETLDAVLNLDQCAIAITRGSVVAVQ